MKMPPLFVENVAELLSGAVMVSEFAPPPESKVIEEAPVAPEELDNINEGVPKRNGPPPWTDTSVLRGIVIEPLELGARKLVVPFVVLT